MDILSYLLSKKASEKIVEENAVQSDLNVNDESDPAYVKNRTHYKEPLKIIEETTIDYYGKQSNNLGAHYIARSSPTCLNDLEEGKTYIVTFGDIKYECVARSRTVPMYDTYVNVQVYVGYFGLYPATITEDEANTDANLPFLVSTAYQRNTATQSGFRLGTNTYAKEQGIRTLEIVTKENLVYHPLDTEFIPDTIARTVIPSSTEGSTKKFKLSIDDSGTITAVEVTD